MNFKIGQRIRARIGGGLLQRSYGYCEVINGVIVKIVGHNSFIEIIDEKDGLIADIWPTVDAVEIINDTEKINWLKEGF